MAINTFWEVLGSMVSLLLRISNLSARAIWFIERSGCLYGLLWFGVWNVRNQCIDLITRTRFSILFSLRAAWSKARIRGFDLKSMTIIFCFFFFAFFIFLCYFSNFILFFSLSLFPFSFSPLLLHRTSSFVSKQVYSHTIKSQIF